MSNTLTLQRSEVNLDTKNWARNLEGWKLAHKTSTIADMQTKLQSLHDDVFKDLNADASLSETEIDMDKVEQFLREHKNFNILAKNEPGTSSPYILCLQLWLKWKGYKDIGLIDGKVKKLSLGGKTLAAIRQFQIDNGLTTTDGIPNQETIDKMLSGTAVAPTVVVTPAPTVTPAPAKKTTPKTTPPAKTTTPPAKTTTPPAGTTTPPSGVEVIEISEFINVKYLLNTRDSFVDMSNPTKSKVDGKRYYVIKNNGKLEKVSHGRYGISKALNHVAISGGLTSGIQVSSDFSYSVEDGDKLVQSMGKIQQALLLLAPNAKKIMSDNGYGLMLGEESLGGLNIVEGKFSDKNKKMITIDYTESADEIRDDIYNTLGLERIKPKAKISQATGYNGEARQQPGNPRNIGTNKPKVNQDLETKPIDDWLMLDAIIKAFEGYDFKQLAPSKITFGIGGCKLINSSTGRQTLTVGDHSITLDLKRKTITGLNETTTKEIVFKTRGETIRMAYMLGSLQAYTGKTLESDPWNISMTGDIEFNQDGSIIDETIIGSSALKAAFPSLDTNEKLESIADYLNGLPLVDTGWGKKK